MKITPSVRLIQIGGRFVLLLIILLVNLGSGGSKTAYAADPPPHDDFINAKVINSIVYTDEDVDTTAATPQGDSVPGDGSDPEIVGPCPDPNPSGTVLLNKGNNTVWYKYTPTVTETISVDTFGTDYDAYLAVWTGTAGNLSLVACNDENFFGQAELSFVGNPGVTYYIQVAQFNGLLVIAHISGIVKKMVGKRLDGQPGESGYTLQNSTQPPQQDVRSIPIAL